MIKRLLLGEKLSSEARLMRGAGSIITSSDSALPSHLPLKGKALDILKNYENSENYLKIVAKG